MFKKFFPLLLTVLFIAACGGGGSSTPQIPVEVLAQSGTAFTEHARDISVDALGNIYITGSTDGNLDGNPGAGSDDMFLIKYDSAGNKQWTRQLGSSAADMGMGVGVDASGFVYVAGFTYGDFDGNVNQGERDIFLVKYDMGGNKIWSKQLGSTAPDLGTGLAVDPDGNCYISGSTSGDLGGGPPGDPDVFVLKYNSDGNLQWTRRLSTPAFDFDTGIVLDPSGNIYVTGSTNGTLWGNPGGPDIFVAQLDTNGNRAWTEVAHIGTAADDMAFGVAVDSAGDIYVAGYTQGDLGGTNTGGTDIVLAKFNFSGGDPVWIKQLGSIGNDKAFGLAVDPSGNIHIAGSSSGDLDGNTNSGDLDLVVVKYDSDGNKLWTKEEGTSSGDYGMAAACGAAGCYVTGDTYGSFPGNTNPGSGTADIFLVKY